MNKDLYSVQQPDKLSQGRVRKATLLDVPALVSLGHKALNRDLPNEVQIDNKALYRLANCCLASSSNYLYVYEFDCKVVASVAAFVSDSPLYVGRQAEVVQFFTSKPGAGIALLRHFRDWIKTSDDIVMTMFSLESYADPRIGKLLMRLGFQESRPSFIMWR